jgi:uncharacterized protein YacL
MLLRIARGFLTLIGAAIGAGIAYLVVWTLKQFNIILIPHYQDLLIYLISGTGFAIIFFMLSSKVIQFTIKSVKWMESKLQEIPMGDMITGSFGLIVGLLIAYLVSFPINQIPLPWLPSVLNIGIYLFLGYMGISIAVKRRDEINWVTFFRRNQKEKSAKDEFLHSQPKILDTSVIIDGRIFDICKTGFIEGPLIIPSFVLEELRHIADSSDSLKRNRGRRGLDVLNRIQKELEIPVKIHEKDFEDIVEVDSKLLKLAQIFKGKVLTNDFNLNKVAEFQGVPVLNINELANAVKPVVLPGEEMAVNVIKDGKEMGQGVAYLDDGTMIVVDGGRKHVGETIDVLVTSVLQTAAGRMIFAKPKAMDKVV